MNKTHAKKTISIILVFIVILGTIAGCSSGSPQAQTGTVSTIPGGSAEPAKLPTVPQAIGTHNTGTLFYLIGSGIASIVSDHTPMRAVVQPYSGPSAWMPDLDSGAISFGVISYVEAAWTYLASSDVPTTPKIRMVMKGNTNENLAWVTAQDSGINSISDLKGKAVAGGYGGTLFSRELLTAGLASVGLTWDDVKVVPVADVTTGLSLLQDGQAVACHGGTATSANTVETHQVVPLKVLPFGNLSPADVEKGISAEMQKIMDQYVPGTTLVVKQPEGIVEEPTVVCSYPLMLCSSTNISDDVVYNTIKACYDYNDDLVVIDKWLKQWTKDNMLDENFKIPYHNGAIRFYKEIGLWTDELQKKQDELLAVMGQ